MTKRVAGPALAGLLAVTLAGTSPSVAAVKIRQPEPSQILLGVEEPETREPREGRVFTGEVIFAQGGQVVAEASEDLEEGERLIAYDPSFRRRGRVRVVRELDRRVYLVRPETSFSISTGYRLARETEIEAAARVLREGRMASYREFLQLFPRSEHRARVAREMFRLTMKAAYPTFPGTVVEGRVRLVEEVGREISLGQALIVLDRYIIARTDERGRFRIEGIPKLEQPVRLRMRVRDQRFQMAEEATVELPAETFAEVAVELPAKVTPTVLLGRVLDDRGAPLPGAEVWTSPYTMEVLTSDSGEYRISRRKRLEGGAPAADEPIFGGEYEVYARRRGYSVDRVTVSAESYEENRVPAIDLVRQDARQEEVPPLRVELAEYLELGPGAGAATAGAGPVLNP